MAAPRSIRSILAAIIAAVGAAKLANAQGFITNCTWQTGLLSGTFLGMYCNDDNWAQYSYDWTWLDTNACLINNGGQLFAYGNGDYRTSCQNCTIFGSNVDFFLTCDCLNTAKQVVSTSYDLNRVIWNHNGILGCFEYMGNQTRAGPF
ncbi:hypothetical protein F4779DRAFT_404555 [Xylariaceae sp. FL0662B]|nr:hypothetical protein F4779DRAFT_404555 [Xylariaceae sp. FL0662B]